MDLARYSRIDIEICLRDIYENLYIKYPDAGHKFWKARLISESILYNNKLISSDYWMNLIYLILNRKRVRNYTYNSNVTIINFNLFSPITKTPIKNNKEEFRILDILGIDYNKNRRIINCRPKPILNDDINEEVW
jgi:hypothetical protein